ncbi:hypothetical protein CTAYLR_005456 [Chrysophaeum taylorii]|uniref:HECT-type E3 ubiquitin transferase n=1 Tax=Chrysophaeum taylorii TaxID=2483200 RepID=A0AAD7ULK7_9STRA|nr:hypothetical protein CTAYLR_005456 [Chrysophaeum taylorii]
MFDGSERTRRAIRLGGRGHQHESDKGELMKRARAERAERAEAKRRGAAATQIGAWLRGRWIAQRHRGEVRRGWDGQMRDLEAVRSVFAARGAAFQVPAVALGSLVRSFLAFFEGPLVDEARLEVMCSTVLRYPSSARHGLSGVQCRGLLEACLAAADARGVATTSWRSLALATCAGDDASPFRPEAATLGLLWINERACGVARAAVLAGRRDDGRRVAVAVAVASVAAAARVANSESPQRVRRARATFALNLLTLDGVDDPVVAALEADLGPTCRALLERRDLDRALPRGIETLLARICDACERGARGASDAVSLAFSIASRLPRAALVDGDAPTRESSRSKRDSGDDDFDSDSDSDQSSSRVLSRVPRKRPASSVALLDTSVASALASRDADLGSNRQLGSSSCPPLASRAFWRAVFAPRGADDDDDDDAPFVSACVLAATVVATCDPAPRARVAIAARPRVVSAIVDAAATNPDVVRRLWRLARHALADSTNLDDAAVVAPSLDPSSSSSSPPANKRPLSSSSKTPRVVASTPAGDASSTRWAPLVLFCCVYTHLLAGLDDDAVAEGESWLGEAEIYDLAALLRDALSRELWRANALQRAPSFRRLYALAVCARLFNQLYDRLEPARRLRVESGFWIWKAVRLSEQLAADDRRDDDENDENGRGGAPPEEDDVVAARDEDGDTEMTARSPDLDSVALSKEPRVAQLLSAMPFVVPFDQRVALFSQLVERDRERYQDDAALFSARRPLAIRVKIRRDHVFDDAFDALFSAGVDLRGRVQVTFVNRAGHQEAGIDGGGVFKEFLDEITKAAFADDADDLFASTPDGALYPRPRRLDRVEFCGRIIGKALYERVLVEPRFARFFLNKALGKYNSFDDLASLDRDLYANLLKLKRVPPDQLDALGLDFQLTTVDPRSNAPLDVELLPGGRDLRVQTANRARYVQLVAHQRLNVETAAASAAFLRGLRAVVPARWLRMFDPRELQTLISGDDAPIDVDDWMNHVQYGGGYHPSQPIIQWFWDIVRSLDHAQRALLLRFVTSCSRPPLLGFSRLRPLIAIHRVPDRDRLPTSSTCMNLLKLPHYADHATLREKLLYSIQEAHGFELS